MEQLITIRQTIIGYYKMYETKVNVIARFLCGFILFLKLSGLAMGGIGTTLSLAIGVFGGVVAAVAPPMGFLILTCLAACACLSLASIEVALLAAVLLFLIAVFYARIFPKESLLILAMLLAFSLKLPYGVVLFGGLYLGAAAIVPVAAGCLLWTFAKHLGELVAVAPRSGFTPLGMLDSMTELYITVTTLLKTDVTWVFQIVIFAIAILCVLLISKSRINFSREIGVILGGAVIILGYVAGILLGVANIHIVGAFVGTVVSVAAVLCVRFFEIVLDYSRCENVEFEDENNYYYVKIVPKAVSKNCGAAAFALGGKKRKTIRTRKERRPVQKESTAMTDQEQ